jgi:hypothetical protein
MIEFMIAPRADARRVVISEKWLNADPAEGPYAPNYPATC